MWTVVRQIFRTAPATASIIFLCSALLAWVFYLMFAEGVDYSTAQEQLGVPQTFVMRSGEAGRSGVLIGPIQIWNGQWWRMILSGLHHGDGPFSSLIHLGLNCLGLWYLGQLLEYRIGSWRTALLFATSLVVSMVPEFLAGSTAVGISGAICAQFGYLLVLRTRDGYIYEMLPDQVVRVMMIWLLACIPATYFDLLRVANLAHFSGLGYGYLAARVAYANAEWRVPARLSFWAAHLLIPVGIYAAVHPVWMAEYHWHRGTQKTRSPQRRMMELRQAVAIKPQLDLAWVELSELYDQNGKLEDAWIAILQGVHNNPSSTSALRRAATLGRTFRAFGAPEWARQKLNEVFDDQAPAWADRLLAQGPVPKFQFPVELPGRTPPNRLGQPITLPELLLPSPNPQNQKLPPPDPDAPDSAAVGIAT